LETDKVWLLIPVGVKLDYLAFKLLVQNKYIRASFPNGLSLFYHVFS